MSITTVTPLAPEPSRENGFGCGENDFIPTSGRPDLDPGLVGHGLALDAPGLEQSTSGPRPNDRGLLSALADETGASTAEYAITVLAACGFAAVLVALLASGEVRELLMNIITSALGMGQ